MKHSMVYFKAEMLSVTYPFLFFKIVIITNCQGRSNHIMVDTSQEIVRAGERTQEISLLIRENLSL